MSREKLLQARQLIQAKRYDDAREILKKLDDPRALEWLNKLNQLNDTKRSSPKIYWVTVVVAVLSAFIGFLIGAIVFNENIVSTPGSEEFAAFRSDYVRFCTNSGFALTGFPQAGDVEARRANCGTEASEFINLIPTQIIQCHAELGVANFDASIDSYMRFLDCVAAKGGDVALATGLASTVAAGGMPPVVLTATAASTYWARFEVTLAAMESEFPITLTAIWAK